ncbi:uncharacterized protein LOC134291005 [Aedes albopictus]|uniref:Reverse transcriptase domain-containing protein n=1 Tax=Aedes albopictus TaxID=7160 RepID=A0ABM2A7L3_AEDAL
MVHIDELKVCVVALYNPISSNPHFSQCYEKLLLDLLDIGYDKLFVIGDFNINVASTQPTLNHVALTRINATFNLSVLPTGPTRITEQTATTIDLMITDSSDSVIKSKTCTGNTISDHEVVYLLARIKVRRSAPQTIRIRNFRAIDPVQLQADFQTTDFQPFYESEDTTVKADLLTTELKELVERHAPERTIVVRDKHTPWITETIKQAIALRNMAYVLYSRNPNRARGNEQWLDYQRKRDRANSLIFAAKKRYAELHFDHNLPAKKLWSNLRREGIHNNAKKNTPPEGLDANELNSFFSDGHRLLQNAGQAQAPTAPLHRSAIDRGIPEFNFRQTDNEEICRKIYDIQTNATGSDEVPISFIKLLCPFILPHLSHLYNSIIESKSFPANWKKAIITPIPKQPNPILPKDFRPISVLPAISKVLEKILLSQITEHLDNPNAPLLARFQSGYRNRYSTTTALAKVVHDVYMNLDNDLCTVMILVDFSLAFNCVSHEILGNKLRREFFFSQAACDLISSFLVRRKQSVRLGGVVSGERDIVDGTPQGSCLSALLFSMYINSLPLSLKCNYHLYADDLQVYISGPASEIDRLVREINIDLEAISRWADANRLAPNPQKTQAIIFNKSRPIMPQTNIIFCGEVVPLSTEVTNLGLKLDRCLSWSHQVNDVVLRTYNVLRTFRRFASVLSLATRRKLVQAVVMPIFMYADVVYYPGLSVALKERLHRCFKSAIRFVYNLRQRETTAAVRNSILGVDLPSNYRLRICCFMRQAYCGNLPDYIEEHLQRGQQQRTRCFIIPRHTTTSGKSVLVYGATYWNGLPNDVKQKPTLPSFKMSTKRLV